jgi:hypothetical protein
VVAGEQFGLNKSQDGGGDGEKKKSQPINLLCNCFKQY